MSFNSVGLDFSSKSEFDGKVLHTINTHILTGCSQTRCVWKEKKCVQVSALEPVRTGSGGDEPMLGGLQKHNINIQIIAKKTLDILKLTSSKTTQVFFESFRNRNRTKGGGEAPADEVDDGVVFELRVCWTRTSTFVCQLQNVILVRELPAHLTAAHRTAGILDTHSCNTYAHTHTLYILSGI